MLTISPAISPGQGLTDYYIGGIDDYYLSSPGEWQGKGAAALGLIGAVERDEFKRVEYGDDPATGKSLVGGKEITGPDGKVLYIKKAGNDMTLSAPKSVSIAAIFDPEIKKIHEQAASKIVDFIEENNTQARQQVKGKRKIIDTGNLVTAKFTHNTSRELDPQLHTHFFLFNLTQKADGQWRALYNHSVFQDKMALGKLYRNEFAHRLQKAGYGIEITDRKDGYFRIRGVPEKLEEHFSKRRAEIEAKVKDPEFRQKYPGISRSKLYQIATLGTRAGKKDVSKEEIEAKWHQEIKNCGYSIQSVKDSIQQHKHQQQLPDNAKKIIDKSVHDITTNNSIFPKAQILKTAAEQSFGQHNIDQLNNAFIGNENIIQLPKSRDNRKRYTSKEMLRVEQSVIQYAKNGQGKRQPLASRREVAEIIANKEKQNGWQYTAGQRAAISALATSKDKVMIIQGDAGTGKTAAMSVVNHLAQSKGYRVRGLGFTGKAADELQQGAGIPSQTIDSFLIKNQFGQKGKEIWLVDESSMTGSRHFQQILTKADKQDATVVFVGDNKQFQSIAAGNMFANLQNKIGVHARLTEVMRQKNAEMRSVVAELNKGNIDKAFLRLDQQCKIKEYGNQNDLRRAAVKRYCKLTSQGHDAVVITASNVDRRQINSSIKNQLVRSGQLPAGTDHTILTPHSVQPSQAGLASSYKKDQVIQVYKSFGKLKAGESGLITGIDNQKNTLTLKTGNKSHTINISKYHGNIAVYNQEQINLSPGDRILFIKNDKKLNVKNGQTGTIKSIDAAGNVKVASGRQNIAFNLYQQQPGSGKYTYQHIDHGMAVTAHKSQGATYDKVIWHAPTKKGRDRQIDRRSAYVAATRARHDFEILTDDKNTLQDAMQKDNGQESVLDVLRDAVTKSVEIAKDMIKEKAEEIETIIEI